MLKLVPRLPGAPQDAASHEVREYYDALFQQLLSHFGSFEAEPRAIGVTSCARGEGVTTVCVNLAASAAHQLNRPVLLIETDARRDRNSYTITGRPTTGLFDVLLGKADVKTCLQTTDFPNVFALGTGIHMARGATRYPKNTFVKLLQELKADYDLIVVDLPHAHELTDRFSICGLVDGVLLVIEAENVRTQVARRAKDLLVQADANLLGVVYNKRQNHVPDWLYRRL